jgi:putative hydrolase of the HAD superfamily
MTPVPTGMAPSGAPPEPVRCLLFDVYGTLFISGSGDIGIARKEARLARGLGHLLARYGLERDSETLLAAFFEAIEADHRAKRAEGIDFPEVEIDRIWQQVLGPARPPGFSVTDFAIDYELMANPVYPMPRLGRVLEEIAVRRIPMGIVSNAQFFTPLLFEWFLGSPLDRLGFDENLLFFSYRHGVAKPSTALFTMAAENLERRGIPKKSVLYLGNDMLNDMLPAVRSGFASALFAGDARSLRLREDHPECRDLATDMVITDLAQLLDHI